MRNKLSKRNSGTGGGRTFPGYKHCVFPPQFVARIRTSSLPVLLVLLVLPSIFQGVTWNKQDVSTCSACSEACFSPGSVSRHPWGIPI